MKTERTLTGMLTVISALFSGVRLGDQNRIQLTDLEDFGGQ